MARKFGKKKDILIDPLAYNIGIAGLSGIGKTTLVKNVCEKLVGDDGYIMLDIGKESGHSCLTGIISEQAPDWDTIDEICDDIVDNRTTDYKDLKVVVFDTLDEMFKLAEDEVIARWNRQNSDKQATSINSVAGGFGRGLDMVIDLVLERIWSLKEVGLSFIVIVHTKAKDIEDPITGQTYQVITANMAQRYFNAIKTKLDILGVAYIDRTIVTEKLGRKDIKGKEITRNKVADEARKVSFRADDYNLDCKCRFPSIVSEIDLDADAFIDAITDAIKAEQAKSGVSFEKAKETQEKAEAENLKKVAEKEEKNREEKALNERLEKIKKFIKDNKSDLDKVRPLAAKAKELGFDNPTKVTTIEAADAIIELIDD